jgi:hypothetical protein
MPRINVLANIARSTLLIALCTIGAACVYRTRHTTEEVQTAIRNAGIIGKEPEQVGDLLRNIRLRNNDSISVSSYEPEYFRIEAAVSPARRTWWTRWQIDVIVSFDSTKKATAVKVDYTAINPL